MTPPIRTNEFRQAMLTTFPTGTVLAKLTGYTTKVNAENIRSVSSTTVCGMVTIDDVLEDKSIHNGASFMHALVRQLQQNWALWFTTDEEMNTIDQEWKNPDTNAYKREKHAYHIV